MTFVVVIQVICPTHQQVKIAICDKRFRIITVDWIAYPGGETNPQAAICSFHKQASQQSNSLY